MSINQSLPLLLLTMITLVLQPRGHAQGNVVNLYHWTIVTATPPGSYTSPTGSVQILSATSAMIYSGQNVFTNPFLLGPSNPTLSGNLNTTPGTAYEIIVTLQNNSQWLCNPYLTFGDFTTNFILPNLGGPNPPIGGPPVNIDFTIAATSAITMMSINPGLYDVGQVSLFNFSVVEAPEVSSAELLALGGGVWWLAPQAWRSLHTRKRNQSTAKTAC